MNGPHVIEGPYPILDAAVLAALDASPDDIALVFARVGINVVQLRCKGEGRAQFDFARRWMTALRDHCPDVAVIVNDRVDIALDLEADGVHVGQSDLPPDVCRRLLGLDRLVGISTHTVAEVASAQALPVDYLGFGPLFATNSKADALTPRGLEPLVAASRAGTKPITAIGGIHLSHLPAIRSAGVASAAMIGALWQENWAERLADSMRLWRAAAES